MRVYSALLAAALLVGGCATLAGPPELTREDIVRMSKAGEAPQRIIERLRETYTVIPLSASDIVQLHQQGVAQEVLDYLQRAQIADLRRQEALLHYHTLPPPYPFWGWRYGWGPWPY